MPTKFPKPLEKLQWRETIFFKLRRNFWSRLEFVNKDCSVIGPERSLHPFEQCDAKLKLIVIWFPAFRGASLVHFFLTEFLLASCHISLCFDWPFGFSTLNLKALLSAWFYVITLVPYFLAPQLQRAWYGSAYERCQEQDMHR